ncbi:hypothetical protein BDQ17DRAFT_1343592 [Cyathus striatus]|nr:hypothetical protein BDQ17DRAFT_1343592 [Cyathus striatus]
MPFAASALSPLLLESLYHTKILSTTRALWLLCLLFILSLRSHCPVHSIHLQVPVERSTCVPFAMFFPRTVRRLSTSGAGRSVLLRLLAIVVLCAGPRVRGFFGGFGCSPSIRVPRGPSLVRVMRTYILSGYAVSPCPLYHGGSLIIYI